MRFSLRSAVLVACALLAGLFLSAPAASADTPEPAPALVHASTQNACKLNVRAGTDVGSPALTTLTCANYTTCVNASSSDQPCGPYLQGGVYTCVGANGSQVTDNRWAEVAWRAPERSYVAVACAAFRL
ncbi:hypothetical protein [Prauserella flavalba]|uniref:Secreted protein n=1 Tax=Prauserella flavalba TaxID=1477506 RepID=A0A318LJJ3_9PSEU|nr:hypothetical protein [Prauserella flavalba]PXY24026.1 hypothetical protein BA062_27600 [Prauserella flavalba]